MTDLFTSHLSKRSQLVLWLEKKVYATTSEVQKFGLENFHIRAKRDCRDLANEGLLQRLDDKEKAFRGWGKSKQDVWKWVGDK